CETNYQYPFGFGLSYTAFSFTGLSANKTSFGPDETVVISVTVSNTGDRAGKEVVQVFISDLIASFTPDVKRLRAFEKVELQPGESRTLRFNLPLSQLAFVNPSNRKQLEAGEFKIQVGNQTANFSVTKSKLF
ncbi:MAG TPA: fibronectin type III-like domain-contianing protein, partial [Flavisolibacter sp.]|nr:fibronectin type III-like domain-contianing protein [Flavisolibacter sp.]